ncbi:MAG: hypothetical protein P8M25_03250 [Paracoccaceae bacterium]|nr:hypothetical protein [Paracoccaceae bacterium]
MAFLAGSDGFPLFDTPTPVANVCMLGLRSVDATELTALAYSHIAHHYMRDIDENYIITPLAQF